MFELSQQNNRTLNSREAELKVLKVVDKHNYEIGKREVTKIRSHMEQGTQPHEVRKLIQKLPESYLPEEHERIMSFVDSISSAQIQDVDNNSSAITHDQQKHSQDSILSIEKPNG